MHLHDGRSEARFSVYNSETEWTGDFRHGEDAAAFVALLGNDAIITDAKTGSILWTEGDELFSASESYDRCAETLESRRTRHRIIENVGT